MPSRDTGEVIEKWDIINENYPVSAIDLYNGGIEVKRKPRGKVKVRRPDSNKITHLSRKSLSRLAFLVTTSNTRFESLMTLTYEKIPLNGRQVKADLNWYLTYLRRRMPHFDLQYLWFLEFQKRGAPHYHILLNIPVPIVSRETILRKWVDITNGSEKAMRVTLHKTSWENIRMEDGAKRYALKYALKPEQKKVPKNYQDVGRFWGVSRGVRALPEVIDFPMPEKELRRIVAEHRKDFNDKCNKFLPKYIFI